jgi:DNA-binding winged helix-turn-helix (wHTH) protein
MRFGDYALDMRRHVLQAPAGEIQLSPLGARLLEVLAQRPGETVEREAIVGELWRGDWLVGDPALNRLVSELRRTVGDDPRNPTLIQTVPRRGYRMVLPFHDGRPEETVVLAASTIQAPRWRQIWELGIVTFAVVVGGLSLLLAMAKLAHN